MIRTLLLAALTVFLLSPVGAMGAREPGGEKVVYSEGFEADTAGFTGRGPNEVVAVDSKAPHSGKQALTISGRTATWNGPMRDMTKVFRKGRTYKIEVWARFDQGPDYQGLNMSVQKSVEGAGDVYENVGAGQMIRGQWTKIEVEYSVPKDVVVSTWKLYFETPYKSDSSVKPEDLITFSIDDMKITQVPSVAKVARKEIPAFQDSFPKGMLIGTAIVSDHFNPENIHHDLLRHFNTFVYGNEMKQDATQPQEGLFRFTAADSLVKFAEKRGVTLRGHTLLWHNQVPAWMFRDPVDPSLPASKGVLLARIEKHIQTIVGRYKGKFHSWDVVNEAIAENGELRDSPYLKIVGSDEYIVRAFQAAHAADPEAKLVLNDYNVEYSGPKQDGFYREVKSLLDRGVPIHAVGLQSHISLGQTTVNDFRAVIQRFAALGVDVQVTELDISIYANGQEPRKAVTRDILTDQALKYAALFQMFKEEYQAGRLSTVLIWGMSDDETWLDNFPTAGRSDHPLLFDKNLQPKPAYWAIVDPSKMPVVIQRTDAFLVSQLPASATDEAWGNVSPKLVRDAQGKVRGWYKVTWAPSGLTVLARVNEPQAGPDDAVVFYLDPTNAKTKTLPSDVVKVTVPRSQAVASDADGYLVMATVPFATPAKTMSKVGFDVKFAGASPVAWNDSGLGQEQNSENWGTLTLKPLPAMVAVSKGTPKVDGNVDPLWNTVQPLPLAVESSGDVDGVSTVKLLWDEGHLYALFEVKDKVLNDKAANPWEQDSVELFLDQNNAKTGTYEADDGQYRVSFRNLQTFNGGQKEGFKSATRLIPGGFRVVMAVPLYTVPGEVGGLMGFDAQINNADGTASRVGIRNWIDGTNMGYQNTSGWGMVKYVP